MADTEKGGLSSVDPTLTFAQKLQQQTSESQRILDEHRKRLMSLMSSRQQMPFDPAGLAFAAGMLAPTKTGGFGESLGYGLSGYAGEAEKQFRREQEEAKLGYELEVGAQQQKRELMGQQLMANMFGAEEPQAAPAPQVAKAELPPTAPVPSRGEAGEAAPAEAPAPAESTQAQIVQAARTLNMPELALPAVPANKIARMTDEQIAMLKAFNPSMGKILEDYRKAFRENRQLQISEVDLNRKLQELEFARRKDIREEKESGFRERKIKLEEESVERTLPGIGNVKMPVSFWNEVNSITKSGDFNQLLDLYKQNNLPINTTVDKDGAVRFMTPSEIEERSKRNEAKFTQQPIKVQIPEYGAGTYDLTPIEYNEYKAAKAKGADALQHWFNGSPFQGTVIRGSKIGTQFNSPELTAPPKAEPVAPEAAPVTEPVFEPVPAPTPERRAAPAPVPVPAIKKQPAPVPVPVPAPAPAARKEVTPPQPYVNAPPARIQSAEELERQRKEEELQRELRKKQEEAKIETGQVAPRERAKEETKADVEFGNQMMKAGNDAPNLRIIAKDLRSIASSNPKIFDVMQDTGVADALSRTVQNGLQTPWGSVSVDPKDLYIAVDNFAAGKKNITKKDRDAYGLFLRNLAQLTVLERRMSRGEGTISDKETGLFQQVNLLPSDSALGIRLKAELIEQRANVTEKLGDAFYQYKKKTGGSYEDFTHSEEYKSIRKSYEDRLDRIRENNAQLLSGRKSPSAPVPQTTLPPQAVKQLKQGQVTTFKNGQVWTLQKGKPVRVK